MIQGVILQVSLRPVFLSGTTMDVVISTVGDDLPSKTILDISGVSAEGWYAVREALVDTDGAPIANQYNDGVPVADFINIDISGGDIGEGDALEVAFIVQPWG
jgi:hypothetical protein